MVVIFDGGRRGWIDNAFEDLDGFWIRDEETEELVCEDNGSGGTDIRNFSATELRFIGEWSHEMETTETVRVPPEAAVTGEHLEEWLLLMQDHCCVEMRLRSCPAEGRWEIAVGPGQAPDVRAGCEAVSEFLAGFCAADEAHVPRTAEALRGASDVVPAGAPIRSANASDGGALPAAADGADSPAVSQEVVAGNQFEGLSATKDPQLHAQAQAQEGSVLDWVFKQEQFAHLPALPVGWIRIRSSSGRIYYLNTETGATTFNEPPKSKSAGSGAPDSPPDLSLASNLPPGWELKTSKSSGKVYFWNAESQVSQFDRPTF